MARNLNGRLDRVEEAVKRARAAGDGEECQSIYHDPIVGYPGRWGDLDENELGWVLIVAETELRRQGRPNEQIHIRQNEVLGYAPWFRFTDEIYEDGLAASIEHGIPLDPETCTRYFTNAGRPGPLGVTFTKILR